MQRPLQLASMPAEAKRGVRFVLTDIDDTLTTEGKLTAQAYAALERLSRSGIRVVPVTGRPAGWCDHIARMWPVDAVVGENGAFYMHYDAVARKLITRFAMTDDERRSMRAKLAAAPKRIVRDVPGCALASDQSYRETDIAIDYCEDVPPLPRDDVDRIVTIMESMGLTAKVSSIHVNGWFGVYDKLTMTRILMRDVFDCDVDSERESVLFIGDSPNDAPMFAWFPNSVGVANVRPFLDRIATPPMYVTDAAAGAGFAEMVDMLTAGRRG